jgi:hypothetical protein
MHYKTWISLLGWTLSVAGWTLWNVALSAVYSAKNSTIYAVRSGFIKHFGGSPKWWLILSIIVGAVLLFEFAAKVAKKTFLPSDVDTWQVLEKDKVIRKRLEEAARGEDAKMDEEGVDSGSPPVTADGVEERELISSPGVGRRGSRRGMPHLTTIPTADSQMLEEYEMSDRRRGSKAR